MRRSVYTTPQLNPLVVLHRAGGEAPTFLPFCVSVSVGRHGMQTEAGVTLCKHVLELLLPWACSEGTGRLRGRTLG